MISVVVPFFNEASGIPRFHAALVDALSGIGTAWEAVYVDDGSADGSLERLLEIQRSDPRVSVVELSRNWGHQPALTAGLSQAHGDAVVLIDGDLQDPPDVIPELLDAWRSGAEVGVAQRRSRRESFLRRALIGAFYWVFGFLSDFPIPLNAGIFCLLDRKVVAVLQGLSESNRYLPGLRAWVGFPSRVVFYDRQARAVGAPKQSLLRLLRYAFDAVFSFSYKPLRLCLASGLLAALWAVVYGSVLLGCRLLGVGLFGIPVVDGYTSTIVSILFLGGVQLIGMGILGEYLGRVYDEVKRRPLFVIRNVHKAP